MIGWADHARPTAHVVKAYTRRRLIASAKLGLAAVPFSVALRLVHDQPLWPGGLVVGFGLGFSVVLDPVAARVISTGGEYAWGGAASTAFFIDPREELVVIFLTQLMPSHVFNFRGQIKQIVYASLLD